MDCNQPVGGSQVNNVSNVTTGQCGIAEQHAVGGTAPSFLRNTHDMITFCDRSKRSVASWGNNGTHVMIHNKDALTNEIFPAYFKHSNFKSFARQLNFYGFRKIKSKNKDCCIYHHDYFQIHRADLLPNIQRQTNENHQENIAMISAQVFPTAVANSNEVTELKDHVKSLTSTITSLRQDIADLKSFVARLADVVQTHDVLIHQPTSQGLHPVASTGIVTNSLQRRTNFGQNELSDESLKPQAKQNSAPNHGSIIRMESRHKEVTPIPYTGLLPQRQDIESFPAKRKRFSPTESLNCASDLTQNQFALPPPAILPVGTAQCEYDDRRDHWRNPTSSSYTEVHHPMSSNQSMHNNQDDILNDHQSVNAVASLHSNPTSSSYPEVHHPMSSNQSIHINQDVILNDHQSVNAVASLHSNPTLSSYTKVHHPMSSNQSIHNNQDDILNVHQSVNAVASLHSNIGECNADNDFAFEDLAWFALFEEDISHKTDDPTAAPQA